MSHFWATSRVVTEFVNPHFAGEMVRLTVGGGSVEATANHPFWVVEGDGLAEPELGQETVPGVPTPGRWAAARDVREGDVVVLRGGVGRVERAGVYESKETTYNFSVEGLEVFAVGTAGILVHNSSDSDKSKTNDQSSGDNQKSEASQNNNDLKSSDDNIAEHANKHFPKKIDIADAEVDRGGSRKMETQICERRRQ